MSASYTINELISGYYEKIFSETAEAPLPKFSLKHRMRMNKIFKQYAKNKEQLLKNGCTAGCSAELVHHKPLSIRKRILIASVIILILAFMTGFVILFISNGFKGTVHYDNTQLFAVNVHDCPSVIEEEYTLSAVPDGYELYEITRSGANSFTVYKNSADQELVFTQTAKPEFSLHINTEGYEFQETDVNGCSAVCAEYKYEARTEALVIWENQNYILSLEGNFTKNELVDLAKSNEICGFLKK